MYVCMYLCKSDLFAPYYVQHFNNTTSRTYLRICMTFKVIKQLNSIGPMKTFTNPNCNLCMQEDLTIPKKLRNKRVTVMNKNLEIYGSCWHKMTFHRSCLSTYDPILTDERVRPLKGFSNIIELKPSTVALNTENILK